MNRVRQAETGGGYHTGPELVLKKNFQRYVLFGV